MAKGRRQYTIVFPKFEVELGLVPAGSVTVWAGSVEEAERKAREFDRCPLHPGSNYMGCRGQH